jgi:hypothetical protein
MRRLRKPRERTAGSTAHDLCQLLGRECQKVVTLAASSYSRFTGADPETQSRAPQQRSGPPIERRSGNVWGRGGFGLNVA